MTHRAFIMGLSGPVLTPDEKTFIAESSPWGIILFKRNIETPAQVLELTSSLRDLTGRNDLPILIDQEGGRVQRMGPPHWPAYPPGRVFGELAKRDPYQAQTITRLGARLMAADLRAVGINVDCVPVCDVPVPGAHDIIGDRAYGASANAIAPLARAAAEGLLAGGVLPVIKHIPGHGRAGADSHEELPVVTATRNALKKQDFIPFQVLSDMPLAMTAHVVYTALDADDPATTSRKVIRSIIRRHIGFDGLLMSDDLSMKALKGTFTERTRRSFEAGCDIVLHCNGKMDEMRPVADASPILAGKALRRANAALIRLVTQPEPFDEPAARAYFKEAVAVLK